MPFSPLPLSRYPPIPQYAIPSVDVSHPSSFISRTPRSRTTCYSPRFPLTHIARLTGRASLIFQSAHSYVRVHLYLLCTCIFSSPSPAPPSFLSSFGPCFPFPLSPSHPLSPPPPSHRLIILVHDPDMHASFSPPYLISTYSLSLSCHIYIYSSTRIYLFSLGYASFNTLFAAFFSLRPSYLISVLIDCWVITTYIYLYSESYFVLLSLFLSLSLFPVPCSLSLSLFCFVYPTFLL